MQFLRSLGIARYSMLLSVTLNFQEFAFDRLSRVLLMSRGRQLYVLFLILRKAAVRTYLRSSRELFLWKVLQCPVLDLNGIYPKLKKRWSEWGYHPRPEGGLWPLRAHSLSFWNKHLNFSAKDARPSRNGKCLIPASLSVSCTNSQPERNLCPSGVSCPAAEDTWTGPWSIWIARQVPLLM